MKNIATREALSLLWIFAIANYIFCDVFSLFYGPNLNEFLSGSVGGMELTQEFLLTFAVIMELAMLMIILSRFLSFPLNRWANIAVGLVMTLVQIGSLIGGDITLHYWFFSAIEVSTTLNIVWTAWNWQEQKI